MTPDMVMPMHQTSIETVEDMSQLGDLHEAAILYNIQQRYTRDKIYVSEVLCVLCVCVCVCVFAHMHVCMYVCMYVCI